MLGGGAAAGGALEIRRKHLSGNRSNVIFIQTPLVGIRNVRMGGNARTMLDAHFSRDRAIARWRDLLDRTTA